MLWMAKKRTYRFPGMDPWLEHPGYWSSVHDALIIHMAEELTRMLAPRYLAWAGQRTVLEITDRKPRPDVAVLARARHVRDGARSSAVADPPILLVVEPDEVPETFIEIRSVHEDKRLVTVVEVLSAANKRSGSDGRAKYLQKQAEHLSSGVHLVEVDLLRGGAHTVAVPEELVHELEEHSYRVAVRRADRRTRAEVYPIPLRRRLPRIPIPLLKPDTDAVVNLQSLLEEVYEAGGFGYGVDYSRHPVPPLDADELVWARGILKGRGRIGQR